MSFQLMILSHKTVYVRQDIDLKKYNKALIINVDICGLGFVHKWYVYCDPKDVENNAIMRKD